MLVCSSNTHHNIENTEDSLDDECLEQVPAHREGTEMLGKLISYFENQNETSANEQLTLKCLQG